MYQAQNWVNHKEGHVESKEIQERENPGETKIKQGKSMDRVHNWLKPQVLFILQHKFEE